MVLALAVLFMFPRLGEGAGFFCGPALGRGACGCCCSLGAEACVLLCVCFWGGGGVWFLSLALEGACVERDFTWGGGVRLLMRALVFVLAQVHYF